MLHEGERARPCLRDDNHANLRRRTNPTKYHKPGLKSATTRTATNATRKTTVAQLGAVAGSCRRLCWRAIEKEGAGIQHEGERVAGPAELDTPRRRA